MIGLFILGCGFEVASDFSYSLMSVTLFDKGKRLDRALWFFGVTLVGIAINVTIPLGTGFLWPITLTQLKSRYSSLRRATAIVVVASVLAIVTLVALLLTTLSSPASPTHQVLSTADLVVLGML